jgi:NAD+ kinase
MPLGSTTAVPQIDDPDDAVPDELVPDDAVPESAAPHARRKVVVLHHYGRDFAVTAAEDVIRELTRLGLDPIKANGAQPDPDVELVVVLGGDGTILRAAELVRGTQVPLLGVNLGHVGFLAEAERDGLSDMVARIAARQYEVEERMTLDVSVYQNGMRIHSTWAVNEASVEKADRERMIEVVLEVDGRPVTEFGCDGVVLATPTGSTAYAFSAGGPVVWPEVEAVLIVPISAHALFARPLVLAPTAVSAVEVLAAGGRGPGGPAGVLWCDGRRSFDLPAGARVEVRRSALPVRLARLARPPFADRLVAKFGLPVHGWRGRSLDGRDVQGRDVQGRDVQGRDVEDPPLDT